MSLIDSLAEKGIELLEGFGKGVQFVGKRAGVVPVQWMHEKRPGLIWRIPEPDTVPLTERVTTASMFSHHQPIVVREYETAIVLENGTFFAEMAAGVYSLSKVPVKGVLEIIWVALNQTQLRWGVGGIMTNDGVSVGAYGVLFVEVGNPKQFVLSVVAGQQAYTEDKIEQWLKNIVAGIMRTELAHSDVRNLMLERDSFVASCAQKLDPILQDWGLRFKHMEVVELNLPPEYRDAVQTVTLAGFGKQKAIIDAQTEAEVLQLKAQAQANARLAAGSADVRVYALMKAHGLDPVKMESIRALMEYAKTPGSTSVGSLVSGDLYKPQVFASLSQVLMDPTIPNDVKNGVRELLPQDALVSPALTDASETSERGQIGESRNATGPEAAGSMTAQQIEEVLDNLDVQLAGGKISETTYNTLKAKWQSRLESITRS